MRHQFGPRYDHSYVKTGFVDHTVWDDSHPNQLQADSPEPVSNNDQLNDITKKRDQTVTYELDTYRSTQSKVGHQRKRKITEANIVEVEKSSCGNSIQDEFTDFAIHIANELRKIPDKLILAIAKHKISNVLFEAEMSYIRKESASSSHVYDHQDPTRNMQYIRSTGYWAATSNDQPDEHFILINKDLPNSHFEKSQKKVISEQNGRLWKRMKKVGEAEVNGKELWQEEEIEIRSNIQPSWLEMGLRLEDDNQTDNTQISSPGEWQDSDDQQKDVNIIPQLVKTKKVLNKQDIVRHVELPHMTSEAVSLPIESIPFAEDPLNSDSDHHKDCNEPSDKFLSGGSEEKVGINSDLNILRDSRESEAQEISMEDKPSARLFTVTLSDAS